MTAVGETTSRSTADRLARKVLLLENEEPRALIPLRGSLLISAIRCVLTYAIIPAATPLVSWSGAVARPVSLLLSSAALVMAVTSLRRVWAADWTHRWAYTTFILVVLALLVLVIALDVRALVG